MSKGHPLITCYPYNDFAKVKRWPKNGLLKRIFYSKGVQSKILFDTGDLYTETAKKKELSCWRKNRGNIWVNGIYFLGCLAVCLYL